MFSFVAINIIDYEYIIHPSVKEIYEMSSIATKHVLCCLIETVKLSYCM